MASIITAAAEDMQGWTQFEYICDSAVVSLHYQKSLHIAHAALDSDLTPRQHTSISTPALPP